MFEAAFKNIDDTLWKDAGCSSELDYIEQTSWILFLKYLDDFESEKETKALLNGERCSRIIHGEFRWAKWAAPKRGSINEANTLAEYINKQYEAAGWRTIAETSAKVRCSYNINAWGNPIQRNYIMRLEADNIPKYKNTNGAFFVRTKSSESGVSQGLRHIKY